MIKKILFGLIKLIGICILAVAVLASFSARWFLTDWGKMDFASVVYQLYSPLKGTSADILSNYVKACVCPTLSIIFILMLLLIFLNGKLDYSFELSLFDEKKEVHLKHNVIAIIKGVVIAALFIGFGIYDYHEAAIIGIPEYISDIMDDSTFIEDNYVDTETTKIVFPKQKRNLVYLYLESMESTFASVEEGGGYTENYIPNLVELRNENITFLNTDVEDAGTNRYNYTMGALFGSSSGLPYKLPVDDNNSAGDYELFFPGLTTLGDILEEEGYRNYFMCGSDAEFSGRAELYEQHGSYTILDYYKAIDEGVIPADYYNNWGMEDQKLYAWAKDKLTEIAASDEPFNFTMLTVDTHHPDGYICDICGNEFDKKYANVIACADRQAYEFVRWIQEQSWYENTTIVIMGDHTSMKSDFWDDLSEDYNRRPYNCFINVADSVETKSVFTGHCFTTADMFPTVLASIGAQIDGDKLALGTNLFSGKETLNDKYDLSFTNPEFHKFSQFYFDKFIKP